jgi:hypothetical protein
LAVSAPVVIPDNKDSIKQLEDQKNILKRNLEILDLSSKYGVGSSNNIEIIAKDIGYMEQKSRETVQKLENLNRETAAINRSKREAELKNTLKEQNDVLNDLRKTGNTAAVDRMRTAFSSIIDRFKAIAPTAKIPPDRTYEDILGESRGAEELALTAWQTSQEKFFKETSDIWMGADVDWNIIPKAQQQFLLDVAASAADALSPLGEYFPAKQYSPAAPVGEEENTYRQAKARREAIEKEVKQLDREKKLYLKESGKYGRTQMESFMGEGDADKRLRDKERMYGKIGNTEAAQDAKDQLTQRASERRSMSGIAKEMGYRGVGELGTKLGQAGLTAADIKGLKSEEAKKKIEDAIQIRIDPYIKPIMPGKAAGVAAAGTVAAPIAPGTAAITAGGIGTRAAPASLVGTGSPKIQEGQLPMVKAPETSNIFSVTFPGMSVNVRFENADQFANEVKKKIEGQIQGMSAKASPNIPYGVQAQAPTG